ncbi:MAG: hypothetical protein RMZ41_001635 [Nostoc sp. DedVER02]|uniref:hypothetical protein n=1 Tax=unclassified Nostoc TaxID=2593658 RepID=UPI002AD327B6|nr:MULTISPECIES: hypothetical protein [unclassified Nostoc]MDZ7987138.1 hypothetical protein [Nostoc sp. DedVER02]MDZ8110992.1 hypothetical protein [Nostoc sp. DedVER01b]
MKYSNLVLATLLSLTSSAILPVLAQGSLMDRELRRRERDSEQLDVQNQIRYLETQATTTKQDEQQKQLILIGFGILIVGGLWLYDKKSKSPP